MFLGDATSVDNGENVVINSEGAGAWTDISKNAQNQKEPGSSHVFYVIPKNPHTGNDLTWGDEWQITVHIVCNQWSSVNGYLQSLIAFVCNDTANSSAGDHFFGGGITNNNGTKIQATRIYENDASTALTFNSSQLVSSGWTTAFRQVTTMENTLDRGLKTMTVEYRDSDNTTESGGNSDLKGYNVGSGLTAFQAGATDAVNLGVYFPGTSTTASNHLTNMQIKIYYMVAVRDADPVAALGI